MSRTFRKDEWPRAHAGRRQTGSLLDEMQLYRSVGGGHCRVIVTWMLLVRAHHPRPVAVFAGWQTSHF